MSNSQIAKVAKESGADHARSHINRERKREREGHRTEPCEASIVPLQVIMHRPQTPRRQQYIQITNVRATGPRASSHTRCSHLPYPSPSHKHTQDETKHMPPHTSHSCHGSDHRHPQSINDQPSRLQLLKLDVKSFIRACRAFETSTSTSSSKISLQQIAHILVGFTMREHVKQNCGAQSGSETRNKC